MRPLSTRRLGPIILLPPLWSPDGRYLAYHNFEAGIAVVDPRRGREYEFELGQYSPGGSFDAYAPDWQPRPPWRRR